MADDLTVRSGQDRKRINLNEKFEVAYWTRKFGVPTAKLQEAVAAVGVMATAVEAFIADAGKGTRRRSAALAKTAAVRKTAAVKKSSPARKTAAKKAAASRPADAIALLRADHKKVSDLFDQFSKTRSAAKKKALVAQICNELTVHAQIEEEIFYPAVKAALRDKELVPEATVEHASVKDLIAQVRGAEPDGEMYDAKVTVMSEFVKHHVKEEQNEMFVRAKKTRLDLVALGEQMSARKEELLAAQDDPATRSLKQLGEAASRSSQAMGNSALPGA